MNDDLHIENDVASFFAATAPSRGPDDLLDHVFLTTGRMRPRPRWLALIKEPPMRISTSVAVGSPTARVTAILATTLLIVSLVAGAGIAGSRLLAADGPIIVDQGDPSALQTITEAVAMAEDGDTVLVRPGTYTEAILVGKDITIQGDGPRDEIVIEAPAGGPTAVGALEPGTSYNFSSYPYAILLSDTTATLSGLTLRGRSSEVHASGGSPTLQDLVFDGIGSVYSGGGPGGANSLVINGGSTATVTGNEFVGDGPIIVFDDSEPLIADNVLTEGSEIVAFVAGDGTVIRGNTISDTIDRAMGVFRPSNLLIEGNTIGDAGGDGITIEWSDGSATPIVRGNTVTGAETGINVNDQAGAMLEGNTITGNVYGLYLGVADGRVRLSGNVVCDNEINLDASEGAPPDIDDTNEICRDLVTEPTE